MVTTRFFSDKSIDERCKILFTPVRKTDFGKFIFKLGVVLRETLNGNFICFDYFLITFYFVILQQMLFFHNTTLNGLKYA